MDQQIQLLLQRLDDLSGEFRELRDGVQKVVQIAKADPEMALTRVRKVLEYIIRDVYKRRCGREPKTQSLESLLQQLVKDKHLPTRIDAYANMIRNLGNVGTHGFGEKVSEKVTMEDVQASLNQLLPILLWYFEVERPEAMKRAPDSNEETQREEEEKERLRAKEETRKQQETEADAARKIRNDADRATKLKQEQQAALLKRKDQPVPKEDAEAQHKELIVKRLGWLLVGLWIVSIALFLIGGASKVAILMLPAAAIIPITILFGYVVRKIESGKTADSHESKKN